MFIRPVTGLYDGGTTADKPKPAYSIAITKRKKGNYQEAVTEIWKQLEKFPHDFEGQMLLAEILAENLNDLPGAKMAVQRLFQQSEHPQRNLALALNALADWQLKQGANPEAARQALQQIIDRFPDSELSAQAAQRIAHLPSVESLIGTHDRKKFVVAEGVPNLGLLDPKFHSQPADAGAAGQAAELVKHLQEHPLDTEARERLAIIYAEHYQRVDLAAEQLEQMIAEPNQPARRVVRWLNLLADLQIRSSASYDTVRATLERIIEMFPDAAPAHLAQNRINRLKMEMKAVQPDKSVKLGTYEENIGLKQGPPGRS